MPNSLNGQLLHSHRKADQNTKQDEWEFKKKSVVFLTWAFLFEKRTIGGQSRLLQGLTGVLENRAHTPTGSVSYRLEHQGPPPNSPAALDGTLAGDVCLPWPAVPQGAARRRPERRLSPRHRPPPLQRQSVQPPVFSTLAAVRHPPPSKPRS